MQDLIMTIYYCFKALKFTLARTAVVVSSTFSLMWKCLPFLYNTYIAYVFAVNHLLPDMYLQV